MDVTRHLYPLKNIFVETRIIFNFLWSLYFFNFSSISHFIFMSILLHIYYYCSRSCIFKQYYHHVIKYAWPSKVCTCRVYRINSWLVLSRKIIHKTTIFHMVQFMCWNHVVWMCCFVCLVDVVTMVFLVDITR